MSDILSHFVEEFESLKTRVSWKSASCLSFLGDYSGGGFIQFAGLFDMSLRDCLWWLIVWSLADGRRIQMTLLSAGCGIE